MTQDAAVRPVRERVLRAGNWRLRRDSCTGVRISECLALRWSHVEWSESKIRIVQTFRRGEIQKRTKTLASKAPVPVCGALAAYLAEWRQQTANSNEEDFIFASPTLNGKQPLWVRQ